MVAEESVRVREVGEGEGAEPELHITVTFTPTVPHCSLATLIGGWVPVIDEMSWCPHSLL